MYHTFQADTAGPAPSKDSGNKTSASARRALTTNACTECRRRKIKCDGAQPCGQCVWYQQPHSCKYSEPAKRLVPSRKLLDRLQSQSEQYHVLFTRLFPGKDLEALVALPREELINVALTLPQPTISPAAYVGAEQISGTPAASDGVESLEALEQPPEDYPQLTLSNRSDKVQDISDDVNGLSLSVDNPSSYVGISSVTAVLKVIFKTAPLARPFIRQTYSDTALPSRSNTPPPQARQLDPHYLPSADVGQKLIESYFAHVHIIMPMVDEEQLRNTYLYGQRRDSPWLALLNMVFALGMLAKSTCENEEHIPYFQRARIHLDSEGFRRGNLLVLQALGLLGGYYLHWLNRPNEANCLMGAAFRMATALGLHREYVEGQSAAVTRTSGPEVPAEIRRKTWWTLYCLDTWAQMYTGRPSLGRAGPGITAQSPKIRSQMNNAQYLASLRLLPLIHNIAFCQIATRIQDRLASQSLMRPEELTALDAELVSWHNELPPILRNVTDSQARKVDFSQSPDKDQCPDMLKTPRALMHWWYQTIRMLMHRPFLLAAALRQSSETNVSADERFAIRKCRTIAGELISNIEATCQEELIAGWAGVWIMYQAVMVPLVSLFWHSTSGGAIDDDQTTDVPLEKLDNTAQWRQQVETSLGFFDRMQQYSVAARKSKDVVERLYAASKHVGSLNVKSHYQQLGGPSVPPPEQTKTTDSTEVSDVATHPHQTQGEAHAFPDNGTWGLSPNGDAAMNVFWDDMMWDTLPEVPDPLQNQTVFTNLNYFDGMQFNGEFGEAGDAFDYE